MTDFIKSPDCRDTNHHKCNGDAWDDQQDRLTACACPCHVMEVPAA